MSRQESISRRNWLKWLLGGGATVVGAEALSRVGKGEMAGVVPVSTDYADYRLVYGVHIIDTNPRTVDGADALLVETQSLTEENARESIEKLMDPQYLSQIRSVLVEARQRRLPIFFVDLSREGKEEVGQQTELIMNMVLTMLEAVLGVPLMIKAKSEYYMTSDQRIARRSFLKRAGMAVAGVYFVTPAVETLVSAAGSMTAASSGGNIEGSLSRVTSRALGTINDAIHPELSEDVVFDLRNRLMAQKMETVAQLLSGELGRRPTLSMYVGAAQDLAFKQ